MQAFACVAYTETAYNASLYRLGHVRLSGRRFNRLSYHVRALGKARYTEKQVPRRKAEDSSHRRKSRINYPKYRINTELTSLGISIIRNKKIPNLCSHTIPDEPMVSESDISCIANITDVRLMWFEGRPNL